MTPARVKEIATKYETLLLKGGSKPERLKDEVPVPGSPARYISTEERLNHLLWMCSALKEIAEQEGRIEKAMRWLGFIQGALWSADIVTIEDLKHDNMPAGAEFSKERV